MASEEAFDAKRLWRKAAEEVVDEALGFDAKRAWRKALASRGTKSYDGLVVATVAYEDGGLADDGTRIWKPLTQYKLPDRAPELQPEDELDLVAAASALGAAAADLSRLQPLVGGTRATNPQHSRRTTTGPQHSTPSRVGVVGSRQQSPTTTPQHSTAQPRPRTPASGSVWASPRALRGESSTRRRLSPSKATSALRCLSPSPLARGTATAVAAAAATATSTVEAAAHWAPPGQPCAEDAPGHGAAPRAGGEVASPRSAEPCQKQARCGRPARPNRLAGRGWPDLGAAAGMLRSSLLGAMLTEAWRALISTQARRRAGSGMWGRR